MTSTAELLIDAVGRIGEQVHAAVEGLRPDQLEFRADPDANSIAWLVWHLSRVQDDHIADVAGVAQVWTAQGYAQRFSLPFDDAEHGYGQTSADVAKVRGLDADLLSAYYDAVQAQTIDYVTGLRDADLDRVVDRRWSPPVTLGVRLVSVISDDLQHAGQAAFIRGILTREVGG